ncbi:hypothetical protein PVAP13_2KG593401 [Panicum virgatum]|uniref:Uncharacterized protein n=1 Tax=Panicum virgatum TaxID=38727 RepID=A0A8T0WK40_PANVG|nr:hypothetical protein PVAP13_2KG593401 [Panicum virgatum]
MGYPDPIAIPLQTALQRMDMMMKKWQLCARHSGPSLAAECLPLPWHLLESFTPIRCPPLLRSTVPERLVPNAASPEPSPGGGGTVPFRRLRDRCLAAAAFARRAEGTHGSTSGGLRL